MSGSMTGGVDAGIALQAGKGVQQPNALQTIGQFAGIQNAMNANRLFPGQLQQQGIATQGQQLTLAKAQNAAAYQSGLPIVSNPNFTLDDLTGAFGSAEKNMGIPTHQVVSDIVSLPLTPNTPEWRQAVKGIITSRSQVDPGSAVGVLTPLAGPDYSNGQAVQPTLRAPAASASPGALSPNGAPIQQYPSRSELATQVGRPATADDAARLQVPAGTPLTETMLQRLTQQGAGALAGPAGAAGVPGQPSPLGTGRLPAALRNPNATHAPASAPSGGPVVTGQSPAAIAEQTTRAGQSALAFQDYAKAGNQAQGQGATLGNMLADANQFTTGPQGVNNFKAWLVRNGAALGTTFGIDPNKVSANESFDKLANQIADAQGAGSDARLAVIQHSNPGSHLSPGGVDSIIRQLQGNADYMQARSKVAAHWPDQTDRATFDDYMRDKLDPRAFQFSRMTPQQKIDYAKNLSDTDRKKLQSSYNWAVKNGALNAGQ